MELVEQVDDEKGAETVEEEGMASSEDMIWIEWWEREREDDGEVDFEKRSRQLENRIFARMRHS